MTESERLARGQNLAAALDSDNLPTHVLWRLTALVGGEDVIYSEAALEEAGRAQAIVFTPSRVVHATFGRSSTREPDKGTSSASCKTWWRNRLSALSIEGIKFNDDWSWNQRWSAVVPRDGQLTLRYGEGTTLALTLRPSTSRSEQLDKLLPGLLADGEGP